MIKFKKSFYPNILKRGLEIGSENVDIVERGDKHYRAIVHGGEDYEVELEIDNNTLVGASCTCPCYYNCKHMAAVLYKLNNEADYSSSLEIDKENIDDIIDEMNIDSLKEIVKEEAKRLPELYKRIIYTRHTLSLDSYLARIDSTLSNSASWYYSHEDDELEALDSLNSLINEVRKFVIPKDINKARIILNSIIARVIEASATSSGIIEAVIESAFKCLKDVYLITKDMTILDDVIGFNGGEYIDYNLKYEILKDLMAKDNAQYILDRLLKDKYQDVETLKGLFNLLELNNHKRIEIIKNVAADSEVVGYLLELYNIEDMESEFNSLASENIDKYKAVVLYQKYRRYLKSDKAKALEMLRKLIAMCFDENYYKKSLELSTMEAEAAYYEGLNYKELMLEIYSYNNDLDNLMRTIKDINEIEFYDDYYDRLGAKNKDIYTKIYYSYVMGNIAFTRNREGYRRLYAYVDKLIRIDADKELMRKLSSFIIAKYSKRPALIDEFSGLFEYVK